MKALLLAGVLCAPASAGPREEFKAAVAAVQKAPADVTLREKVIALALKLKPSPAVPAEARRPFVMAATYQKEAKKPAEFGLAVDSYREAVRLAPWWGDAYYNLSVALESAGRLDEARETLGLYLLTKPKDAEGAQDRLFALEAKKNLASKQSEADELIVPGQGVGPLRLGMTDAEVSSALGVHGEAGQHVRDYRAAGIIAFTGMKSGLLTHVSVQTRRHHTAEGLHLGSSRAEVEAALGPPSERFDSSISPTGATGHCYRLNGGATWFWFDDAGQSVTNITVVPGCDYR